jgi:hypothetical protein
LFDFENILTEGDVLIDNPVGETVAVPIGGLWAKAICDAVKLAAGHAGVITIQMG